MGQEQAAVEVADAAKQDSGFRAAGGLGLGEALEEEGFEEHGVEGVGPAFAALGQLIFQVMFVPAVQE